MGVSEPNVIDGKPGFTRINVSSWTPPDKISLENLSAHVSFCNGLEFIGNWLEFICPCFILQWAGMDLPKFHFAMGWN
jgi:hypothetical protein